MEILKILLSIFIFLLAQTCYAGLLSPTAKVTVKVIDTRGNPLEGAKVILQYHVNKGAGMGWGVNTKTVEGLTGKDGQFTGEGESIDYCNFGAEKEGYYDSSDIYRFKEVSALKRWEPWNPTVAVVLKEKRNPVAMYAKRTGDLKVPVLEKPVGYDLEKGDWVAPYGGGVISDLIFTCKARFASRDDWDCSYKLSFPKTMDGIQEFITDKSDRSRYRWPYLAMETGYKPELIWSDSYNINKKHEPAYDANRLYIFRVRTIVDEKGNIVSANYGKIKGDIRFFPDGNLKFEYYFNPTGNRNLEYDRNKSLFKWKKIDEIDQYKVNGP